MVVLEHFPQKHLTNLVKIYFSWVQINGNYTISVEFVGNDKYNPSSLTKTITVTSKCSGNSIYNYMTTIIMVTV